MNESLTHLVLIHIESVPKDFLHDFEKQVRVDGLELAVRSRPSVPYAAIEWLMPSAIVAYLAKPYFESFLKEMGKDHYGILKDGLKRLYRRVASENSPEIKVVTTPGKVARSQPYSRFFSVVVEAPTGTCFKLLIPRPISESEYAAAITAFLEFSQKLHSQRPDQRIELDLENIPNIGGMILVAYDVSEKRLKPINPLPENKRRNPNEYS